MLELAVSLLPWFSPVIGENLLMNSSFEDAMPDGRPRGWNPFIMPQPGAFADLDPLSFGGGRAAMLHIPEPYAREPANNWSQVIIADVRGKTIEFSGYVRTEAAGQAALWLQCFQQSPARVIAAQTSALNDPLSGTAEWTRLAARVTAPASTDFVVVRCVLKGSGSAWFDELRLDIVLQDAPPLEVIEPPEAPALSPAPASELSGTDLLQLSQALQRAVADLESSNAQILNRIHELQLELDSSRTAAEHLQAGSQEYGPHPLVPRGYRGGGGPP
jgi:hypothetical protein